MTKTILVTTRRTHLFHWSRIVTLSISVPDMMLVMVDSMSSSTPPYHTMPFHESIRKKSTTTNTEALFEPNLSFRVILYSNDTIQLVELKMVRVLRLSHKPTPVAEFQPRWQTTLQASLPPTRHHWWQMHSLPFKPDFPRSWQVVNTLKTDSYRRSGELHQSSNTRIRFTTRQLTLLDVRGAATTTV